jgi:hypothetical protein
LLVGGTWTEPLRLTEAGSITGTVGPTADDDTITITVTLEGEILDTYTVTVTGVAPPVESPDDEPPDESDESGGCAGTDDSQRHHIALMVILWMSLLQGRRSTRPWGLGGTWLH